MSALYFEDLSVGQRFVSDTLRVERDDIVAFARAFDPQPFHLDEIAARDSIFEELVASGWHTAALTMRLVIASPFRPAGGVIGGGGELTWSRPVRPGDTLQVESEVMELRPSRSRPSHGLARMRLTTRNQDRETVQTFAPLLLVPRRPEASSAAGEGSAGFSDTRADC